jgi:hypothetical protein
MTGFSVEMTTDNGNMSPIESTAPLREPHGARVIAA